MARLLITGSTGLIGQHLLARLGPPHELFALTREATLPDLANVTWIRHDRTAPALPADMPEGIDAVIHLAQSPHFREFPEQASHIFGVNVQSTMQLLDWARRTNVSRFIYASSGGIYGHGEHEFSEDDSVIARDPQGFYIASKRAGELLVENSAPCFAVTILRFFFVYGLGQRPGMLVPRLVRSVAEGQPITLQGPDGLRLNPVHVSDAVAAIVQALGLEESHKINIGGPEILTLRRIGEIIGETLGKAPVFHVDEAATPNHLVGDIRKMSALLGAPRVPFHEGVRALCAEPGLAVRPE